ncbi:hypothetical protein QE439_002497 [Pedobacter agri]|nr:hypothetical protein [Pedobacter agri]
MDFFAPHRRQPSPFGLAQKGTKPERSESMPTIEDINSQA